MHDKIAGHRTLMNKLKYQNIFENVPIGIIYFDTKCTVTDSNNYAFESVNLTV